MSTNKVLKWAAATAAVGIMAVVTVPAMAAHATHRLSATTRPVHAVTARKTHVSRLTHLSHVAKAKHVTTRHAKAAVKRLTHKPKVVSSHKHKAVTKAAARASGLDKHVSSAFTM